MGAEGTLLIDAGQIFREDVEAAAARITMLEEVGATWLEEPFHGGAYDAYGKLAARSGRIKLAGGEASHNVHMARQLIDYGKVVLHPDRLRPHRRHRAGQAGRRLCRRREA